MSQEVPSCLFVNHIHPTNNAYISPIEKWDLDGTYNGLASDLHRNCEKGLWYYGKTKIWQEKVVK